MPHQAGETIMTGANAGFLNLLTIPASTCTGSWPCSREWLGARTGIGFRFLPEWFDNPDRYGGVSQGKERTSCRRNETRSMTSEPPRTSTW